ncbi:interleukin-8-like isoform X1 [Silurus meridionalis]|uniref:interleukin-8-like isoform X1 n=1 Tax=Silurus meridionalis TaxID=175797 RepID=UPI001EEA94C5|nr:interleukin-8-like isoform X1 [Silurus meridionalis]
MSTSVLALTFFVCALLALTKAGLPPPQHRCRCTETVSKEISVHRIMKLEIFPPGAHCKDTEVIATVKFRKEMMLCLNPNEKWVQMIIKRRNLNS